MATSTPTSTRREFGSASPAAHVAEALAVLADPRPRLNEHVWQQDRLVFERVVDTWARQAGPGLREEVDPLVRLAASEERGRTALDALVAAIEPSIAGVDLSATMVEVDRVYTRLQPGDGDLELVSPRPGGAHTTAQGAALTVVVPFRGRSVDRVRNLETCLRVLRRASGQWGDVEISVVEQDAETRLSTVPRTLYDSHHLAWNPGPFNKSWGVNLGVGRAASELVCILDSDILMDDTVLARVLDGLGAHDLFTPHRRVVWMDGATTGYVVESVRAAAGAVRVDANAARGYAIDGALGGCVGVRRSFYDEIGGHDERFEGWGDEDNEFHRRASRRGDAGSGDLVLAHLDHARAVSTTTVGERLNGHLRDSADPSPSAAATGSFGKYGRG